MFLLFFKRVIYVNYDFIYKGAEVVFSGQGSAYSEAYEQFLGQTAIVIDIEYGEKKRVEFGSDLVTLMFGTERIRMFAYRLSPPLNHVHILF